MAKLYNKQLIFVYGTLMKKLNLDAHSFLIDAKVVSLDAYTVGKLFDIGEYPGIILPEQDSINFYNVWGEIYEISQNLLEKLDEYEGCNQNYPNPHEYSRKKIVVYTKSDIYSCWVYKYNYDVSKLNEIKSGKYLTKAL